MGTHAQAVNTRPLPLLPCSLGMKLVNTLRKVTRETAICSTPTANSSLHLQESAQAADIFWGTWPTTVLPHTTASTAIALDSHCLPGSRLLYVS